MLMRTAGGFHTFICVIIGRVFIASGRSRAICPGTVSFFYYIRAIHSAFFNTRRDRSDCSEGNSRSAGQRESCYAQLFVYVFWRRNGRWIIQMDSM